VKIVYAGPTFWSLDQATEVMKAYREFILKAPEYVNAFFAFLTIPPAPMFPDNLHLRKVCGVMWCCNGPADKAEAAIKPMRSVGKPILDGVGEMPFPVLQSLFDGLYPPGLQWYWRADFVKELTDEAIALHADHGAKLPTMHSTMHLYAIDGKAHAVGKNDTAFSYRDANWAEVIVGVDPDPANTNVITKWCKEYFDALHPYSAGGAYVNFMMEEGQERVQASFRDNYARLLAIKKKYDPTNFFRICRRRSRSSPNSMVPPGRRTSGPRLAPGSAPSWMDCPCAAAHSLHRPSRCSTAASRRRSRSIDGSRTGPRCPAPHCQ
jgi:hypothetical protein